MNRVKRELAKKGFRVHPDENAPHVYEGIDIYIKNNDLHFDEVWSVVSFEYRMDRDGKIWATGFGNGEDLAVPIPVEEW